MVGQNTAAGTHITKLLRTGGKPPICGCVILIGVDLADLALAALQGEDVEWQDVTSTIIIDILLYAGIPLAAKLFVAGAGAALVGLGIIVSLPASVAALAVVLASVLAWYLISVTGLDEWLKKELGEGLKAAADKFEGYVESQWPYYKRWVMDRVWQENREKGCTVNFYGDPVGHGITQEEEIRLSPLFKPYR